MNHKIAVFVVEFIKCHVIEVLVHIYEHLNIDLKDNVSRNCTNIWVLIIVQVVNELLFKVVSFIEDEVYAV